MLDFFTDLVQGHFGHLTIKVKVKLLPFFPSWLKFRPPKHESTFLFFEIQITFEYKANESLTFQSQKSTFWLLQHWPFPSILSFWIWIRIHIFNIQITFKHKVLFKTDHQQLYHIYICRFLSLYLIRTILIILTCCSKLILYELAGKPNEPIDHGLQWSEINWLNLFRPSKSIFVN